MAEDMSFEREEGDERKSVLRHALQERDLGSADRAMSLLLDVRTPEELEPNDLILSLDAMERLGELAQAAMFQPFIEFAVVHPDRALPALIARLKQTPVSHAGRLCAAVLAELLEHHDPGVVLTRRETAAPALIAAVASAANTEPDLGREAIGALAAWSNHDALPEARGAVEAWLDAAVRASEPAQYSINHARTILAPP